VKLTYVESHKAIEIANAVFKFNGWSCNIVSLKEDYVIACMVFIVALGLLGRLKMMVASGAVEFVQLLEFR
jgi:recombination DNA repair RAD52 pathway protein